MAAGAVGRCLMLAAFVMVSRRSGWQQAMTADAAGHWPAPASSCSPGRCSAPPSACWYSPWGCPLVGLLLVVWRLGAGRLVRSRSGLRPGPLLRASPPGQGARGRGRPGAAGVPRAPPGRGPSRRYAIGRARFLGCGPGNGGTGVRRRRARAMPDLFARPSTSTGRRGSRSASRRALYRAGPDGPDFRQTTGDRHDVPARGM